MKFFGGVVGLISNTGKERKIISKSSDIGSSREKAKSFRSLDVDIEKRAHLDEEGVSCLAMQFWESRIFLALVEFGLYSEISHSQNGLTHAELVKQLSLHERLRPDVFDALVSMKVLSRIGNGPDALYTNTPETEHYLVKSRTETYIGDFLISCGKRAYPLWADYTKSLTDETVKCPLINELLSQRDAKVAEFKGEELCPMHILYVAYGFVMSRVLLTAFELNVFEVIENSKKRAMSAKQIRSKLMIVDLEAAKEFLNCLVKVEALHSETVDDGKAMYFNTCETAKMVKNDRSTSRIDFINMSSTRLYRFWNELPDALVTGFKQNEISQQKFHKQLYENPIALNGFLRAVNGLSSGGRREFLKTFDLTPFKTITDVGGSTGVLSIAISEKYPHITKCTTTDLPHVMPLVVKNTGKSSIHVQETVKFYASDFLEESIPQSDVIIMSVILHDWPFSVKKMLIEKAYSALPENGVFIVIDSMIDNDRRERTFGLCMSVNMLIELGVDGGYDYTEDEIINWCEQAGFAKTYVRPLTHDFFMCVAYKN